MLHGGPEIEEDRGVVNDLIGDELGDLLFGLGGDTLALQVWEFEGGVVLCCLRPL